MQYPYESDYIEDEMEARATISYICKEVIYYFKYKKVSKNGW